MAGKEEAGEAKPQPKSRKLLIIAAALLVLLAAGGGGAYYVLAAPKAPVEPAPAEAGAPGHAGPEAAAAHDDSTAGAEGGQGGAEGDHGKAAPAFVDLPDILVNLRGDARRLHFLKLRVTLEASKNADADSLTQVMPRVLDSFQLYLRDLSVDDLKGSEGLQLIKEELLARLNLVVEPTRVQDILFKEMLVQ